MRKIAISTAFAATALMLSACSDGADEPAEGTIVDANADAAAGADAAITELPTVLDANSATAAQLATKEGVSDELAAAIVAGQPYASVTNLYTTLRDTLTEEQAAAVLASVFVPVNLNSATEEELRLIPGMNDKMVHEFEEYRPYAAMEDFNREIGKYVDEAEVARFRNYVTL